MDKQATNNSPFISNRADPWLYRHSDGYYYFTATEPGYQYIELRRSRTLAGVAQASPVVAWRKHETGPLSSHIWAPEIHYIEGKWYIYFAAAATPDTTNGMFDHRMYVLENESENPLEGTWAEKGQLRTNWESFSLDATTFEHDGTRYLVWAQKDPAIHGNSNLYIARMDTPWSISGDQVLITVPELEWETIGFMVNEGPAVLVRNGRIYLAYSASATDHHYCMGLLVANETDDLLNPVSWNKNKVPVFATNEAKGRFGPGHNSFTQSEDGKQDILVYHARTYKEIDGDPLNDPNRHTFIRSFGWSANGLPDFEANLK